MAVVWLAVFANDVFLEAQRDDGTATPAEQ
jgi:hypothetical protein